MPEIRSLDIIVYRNMLTSAEAGVAQTVTLKELTESMSTPDIVSDKALARQFFFGRLKTGAGKGDHAVEVVSALVLDCDGITVKELEHLIDWADKKNLFGILHSTFRHPESMRAEKLARVRLVLPLSRDVLPSEYKILWTIVGYDTGVRIDRTGRAPSKHYLTYSLPDDWDEEEAGEDENLFHVFEGNLLDPDALGVGDRLDEIANFEVSHEEGTQPVTGAIFQQFLERRIRGKDKDTHDAIKRGAAHEPMAVKGSREKTYFAAANLLAHEFPHGNPDDICEFLERSIQSVFDADPKDAPSMAAFRDKLVRTQRNVLATAAKRRLETEAKDAKEERRKFEATTYDEETLKEYFEATNGRIHLQSLKNALILMDRSNVYVFNGRGYDITGFRSALPTIWKNLRYRAEDHLDFDFYYPNEDGPPKEKSLDHFIRDHGDPVREVIHTHRTTSFYDPGERILRLRHSRSPLVEFRGERSRDVEEWMRVAINEDEDLFNKWQQWCALLVAHDQPLAGLVLVGPSGVGKSAFVEGLAQLWGVSATDMVKLFSDNFNGEMLRTPLLHADEGMPKDRFGRVPVEQLKTLVSSGHHAINEKGQNIKTLEGYMRLVFTLQNVDKFSVGRGNTREDVEALMPRYLFAEMIKAASAFFKYDRFVTQGEIARHCIYLYEQLKMERLRFGVETNGQEYITTADPFTMDVADVIISRMMDRAAQMEPPKPGSQVDVFMNKGLVYVNKEGLLDKWSSVVSNNRVKEPKSQEIQNALASMSIHSEAKRIRYDSFRLRYWVLSTETLGRRALSTGDASIEELELILQAHTFLNFRDKQQELSDEEMKESLDARKQYRSLRGLPVEESDD